MSKENLLDQIEPACIQFNVNKPIFNRLDNDKQTGCISYLHSHFIVFFTFSIHRNMKFPNSTKINFRCTPQFDFQLSTHIVANDWNHISCSDSLVVPPRSSFWFQNRNSFSLQSEDMRGADQKVKPRYYMS